MLKFLKWLFTFIFGSDKNKRFARFIIFVTLLILGFNLAFNVGYTKEKGFYWKPFEASYQGGKK